MLNLVAFSKDRPAQLDLLLRSVRRFAGPAATTAVVYTASDELYERGYRAVREEHPGVTFVDEREAGGFKAATLGLVAEAGDLVAFLVDDIVFTHPLDLDAPALRALAEDPGVLCCSLRLDPGKTYCYALDRPMTPPPATTWDWAGMEGDWGYPMSLDGHVFRTAEIRPLLERLDHVNPNELEAALAAAPPALPRATCFDVARLVNVPDNRVQDTAANRHAGGSPRMLAGAFLAGRRLDLEPFDGLRVPSVHHEMPLRFAQDGPVPRVSVVIPCHNMADTLTEAVESVRASQLSGGIEIIVVDDGSTDASAAVARDLGVVVLEQPASGHPAHARNAGFAAARGEYVLPLDADDRIQPGFLAATVAALDVHAHAGFAYGDELDFGAGEDVLHITPAYDFATLTRQNFLGSATLVRREAWERVGGYDAELGYEDWDLWIALGHAGWHGVKAADAVFEHRVSDDGRWAGDIARDREVKAAFVLKRPELYDAAQIDWARAVLAGEPAAPDHVGFIPTIMAPAAVPTPIDARRVAIAALADELVADPSLLRAYGTAFDADDDVTLVIYSDAAPDQVAERLGPVIAAADLEGPRAPDLLAVLGAAPQEAAVAARSTALLSRRAPTGPLATLPRFDDARVAELRTLAVGTPMHALYGQFVRSGDVVFDVGANLGTRSEVFLDLGARVVAVEPQAPLAAQLRDRWAAESRFRLVEGGLGAAEGTAELFLSDAHPITSMSREFIEATTASGRFAAQRWDDVAVVDITTLDRLIDAHGVPAFVKIDVEGFEHEVLCGLSRPVGAASIEFASETVATSTARCIERFAELGMTEFNLSLGESMAWHLPRWVDRDTILAVLRELPGELPWGDVYARLPVAGDFEVPADMAWAFGPDGFYEQDVTMWFDRLMERSGAKVVYDVGANCGWFAVRAAQAGAAVRAFEPVPGTADVLERNLRGTADTRIVRAAVGREPGTALMHLYSSSGNNSLVERTLPPGHPLRHTGRHEVEIVCLDDVVGTDGFPAPELVKIDVEGFELAVLQGARETLRRHQPALLLEWSTATCRDAGYDRGELVTELSGLGYDVWAISAHGQLVDPAMAGEDAETLVAAAPGVALRAPAAAPASPEQQFLADLEAYRAMPGAEAVRDEDLNPQLHDRLPTTPYDQHYFFQDTWAARRVADLRPARHVDVGSRIDLVAFLTAICPVTFVDIRPLEVELEDFESLAGSILDLPFADQTLASLSCLHVAEHIGLGRYGDPLDPHGTRKAAAELQRVLAVGGQLLFSGPVGRARTCFNAHRVHDPRVVVEEYFPELELVEFSGVDDAGVFRRHRSVEEFVGASYACGMFRFVRPED